MYRGAEGHELQRMRHQGYTRFLSFSLLDFHFCLSLPAEFTVDMWITEYTSSGQTDCASHTHMHARTHVLHQLPQRSASFTDGVRKFCTSIVIPSWNFQLPLYPLLCISILRHQSHLLLLLLLLTAAPTHLQRSCHRPFLSFSLFITHSFLPFSESLLTAAVAPPPTILVPLRHPNLSSLIRLPFAPTSSLFQ